MDTHAQPDAPYVHLIDDVAFQPVFILGRARSGTTLLHQLIANSDRFNYVSAYHVIKHNQILRNHVQGEEAQVRAELARLFESLRLQDREIDHMGVTPDTAEEYGFVLHNAAYPRFFKVDGPSYKRVFQKFMINRYNEALFLEFCRKVQYTAPDPGRPLLLKNPGDYLDFLNLKRLFPHARLIFIHRHPVHVLNSQIKTSRAVTGRRNEYYALIDPTYANLHTRPLRLALARFFAQSTTGVGLRTMARTAQKILNDYIRNIQQLQPQDYVAVRYEDLVADTPGTLRHIFDYLQMEPPAHFTYDLIRPRPVKLLPEIQTNYAAICDILREPMRHFGYEP